MDTTPASRHFGAREHGEGERLWQMPGRCWLLDEVAPVPEGAFRTPHCAERPDRKVVGLVAASLPGASRGGQDPPQDWMWARVPYACPLPSLPPPPNYRNKT